VIIRFETAVTCFSVVALVEKQEASSDKQNHFNVFANDVAFILFFISKD